MDAPNCFVTRSVAVPAPWPMSGERIASVKTATHISARPSGTDRGAVYRNALVSLFREALSQGWDAEDGRECNRPQNQ